MSRKPKSYKHTKPWLALQRNTQATLSPCRSATRASQPDLNLPGKDTQQTPASVQVANKSGGQERSQSEQSLMHTVIKLSPKQRQIKPLDM